MDRISKAITRTARIDNDAHRYDVDNGRKAIFLKGTSVRGKPIDNILGGRSLVPIKVCPKLL